MPSVVIDFAAFKAVRAIVSSAVVFWEKMATAISGEKQLWRRLCLL